MNGKKVKLITNPGHKASSDNGNRGNGKEYTVTERYSKDKSWYLTDVYGNSAGWVYEWEMESYNLGLKELEQELSEVQTKLENIQFKIEWIKETGLEEFNEDEFKVYQTLKFLDDGKLSRIEKSKLIAELIKK